MNTELLKGKKWFKTKEFFENNTQIEHKTENESLQLPKSINSFHDIGI